MIGIYCITNIKNGLRYVGQSRQIEKRFLDHLRYDIKLNTKLGKDILEFGKSNFSLTILQECSISELDELEKYWIKKLNTYPNEYNMTPGGRDRVVDYNTIRAISKEQISKDWEEGLCIKEIQNKYKAGSSKAIKNQLIELGYTEEEIKERGLRKKIKVQGKKVVQLDSNNNVLNVYDSLNEAGRALNLSSQNIGKVCKGLRNFCGGYRWKYFDDFGDEFNG